MTEQSDVPVRPLNVRIRNQGGTTYLGTGQHKVELSDTGTFLWKQVDGKRSVAEIGALLAGEYGIPAADAVADAGEFFAELAGLDVLTFRAGAG